MIGIPSFAQLPVARASSPQQLVNLIIDPRPPVLIANGRAYSALVLQFVNESSNLPAVPTHNVAISLTSSDLHVGNVSASVVFPAGQIFYIANFTTTDFPGTTQITAMANGSMPSVPGDATVKTVLGAGPASALELFANPSVIPASKSANSTITVEAVDSQGDPIQLPQTVNVALSSSDIAVGTIANSLVIPAGKSFAATNFTATTTQGSSLLSASANGFNASEISITTVTSSNPGISLDVQVSPPQLIADGQVYSNVVSVILRDGSGNPVMASSSVNVNLNVSNLSPGTLLRDQATIKSGAFSTYVSFNSSKIPGSTEIFASAQNFVSASANVTTLAPPATMLQLYSIETPVLAGGATYQNLIAVQLQQPGGTPAEATSNIYVELGTASSLLGTVSPSVTIPQGSDFAFVNLTTASEAGTINITAIASGFLPSETSVSSVFLPASVVVSESPKDIPNSATSVVTVTASSEGAVLVGASVSWNVLGGTAEGTFSGATLVTNSSGMASATFNPGTVYGAIPLLISVSKPDYLPNSVSGSVEVYSQIISASFTESPNPTTVSNESSLDLYVTSSGTPLSNATVQWSASAGTLFNASASTNLNGTATAIYEAGPDAGAVQLQAKVSKPGYFTYLANLTDNVYTPTLSVLNNAPQSIRGGENASLSIQVTSHGRAIPNASVSWQVVSGPIAKLVGRTSTNSSGYSSAELSTSAASGAAEIQAMISKAGFPNYTDDIELDVTLLNMTVQVFEPHPAIVENYTSAFSLLVTSSGAPLNNASIIWTSTGGRLVSHSLSTNATGYASAVYVSGYQTGNMSVHALITKTGYYNFSETIYIVVVAPYVGGSLGSGVGGSKNVLTIELGNVIPVWALIVIAGGAGAGFFFYRKKRSAGAYYEEE